MYLGMKVLQINATYGIGSTGVITKDIASICRQNGIHSYVAFPKGFGKVDQGVGYYEIGSWLDHKIHAVLCRIAGKQAYYSSIATMRLLRYIHALKPDIVHLHNLHSNYINLDMLLRYLASNKYKTVITMHDCWYFTGGCFHYTAAGCRKWQVHCEDCVKRMEDTPAYIYDASSRIHSDRIRCFSKFRNLTLVGVSEWITCQAKVSRIRNFCNILCIHNGFDLDLFRNRVSDFRQKMGLHDKFIILGPATKWLQPINGDTLAYFSKCLPDDAVLLLFGGSNASELLHSNVILLGFMRNRIEMAELYSMADVMVNCSREDSLSSLNIEAQACGTPVITYNATGNMETVNEECSFSVEDGNYIALFNRMMQIYNEGKQSFSSRCRRFVGENFDKTENYRKYLNLYEEIVNG